ncbi:MAG: hypothetical protein QOI47_520 [Actinomycetota bacterium]|nr:hypothetical protein [Actinomycetota bacterium]
MVTDRPPREVSLAPGALAYVMINKYRCDIGDRAVARVIELTPPKATARLTLRLGDYRDSGYCGPGDPGSFVSISPVEPTELATYRLNDFDTTQP